MTFRPTYPDPIDLNPGDLCVYIGNVEFSQLVPRVIYRVTKKEPSTWGGTGEALSRWHFTFEPAFDMFSTSHTENTRSVRSKNGTRGIKKLTVLEMGALRRAFDEFLTFWARTHEPG